MSATIDLWLPKFIILLRNYDRHKFASDLAAGLTVGLVALPLAMAFAISSGMTPEAGLYCAMVTGFVISTLGGSKTPIAGRPGRSLWWLRELSPCTASPACLSARWHDDGGCAAGFFWANGRGGEVFPAAGDCRIHERNRFYLVRPKFADIPEELDSLPQIVILRLRNMTAIDATGLGAIRELADRVHTSGRQLLLCGACRQPAQLMKQAEFERHVGAEIFATVLRPRWHERQSCTKHSASLYCRQLCSSIH
jgi:MFS superfamily sulfate permease-like transporter